MERLHKESFEPIKKWATVRKTNLNKRTGTLCNKLLMSVTVMSVKNYNNLELLKLTSYWSTGQKYLIYAGNHSKLQLKMRYHWLIQFLN